MSSVPSHFTLNDGNRLPAVGFGCYKVDAGQSAVDVVLQALKSGYRHVDTAQFYENEGAVGEAIRQAGLKPEDVFVTSKVTMANFGYEETKRSVLASRELLGLPSIDLMLLHAPGNDRKARYESWRALEELQAAGVVKSIGVSNFSEEHLKALFEVCKVKPAVNQVEIHPFLTRQKLADFCREHGILMQAFSPLAKGKKMTDPTLLKLAEKYNVKPAQIMIRWCLQKGYSPLPKSVTPSRVLENIDVFSFEISKEDVALLDALDEYFTTGWDPIKQHAV